MTSDRWESAACRGVDPEVFFPWADKDTKAGSRQRADAIAVCTRCPIRSMCLEWALETGQDSGVWGGLDEENRRAIRLVKSLAVVR